MYLNTNLNTKTDSTIINCVVLFFKLPLPDSNFKIAHHKNCRQIIQILSKKLDPKALPPKFKSTILFIKVNFKLVN